MPLYEYICGKCKEVTEVIQSFKEGPLKICPHCGSKKLRKLASAPAIQFKGSGWYVTDYGGKRGDKGGGESPEEGTRKGSARGGGKAGTPEKTGRRGRKGGTEAGRKGPPK